LRQVPCFKEIFRTLKPGSTFVGYEWCMTDKYDSKNEEHRRIKKGIEEGDSLPDLVHTSEVNRALEAAGFKVVESADISPSEGPNEVPWYQTLEATGFSLSVANMKHSRVGIALTHAMCAVMEFLRLAPKGTTATHAFLIKAPPALVAGGKTGIFTPMYYFKAVKPAQAGRR